MHYYSFQKIGYIIVIAELLFSCITTISIWLPTRPENSSFVLNCLGKDDVIYFDYDYFIEGCGNTSCEVTSSGIQNPKD